MIRYKQPRPNSARLSIWTTSEKREISGAQTPAGRPPIQQSETETWGSSSEKVRYSMRTSGWFREKAPTHWSEGIRARTVAKTIPSAVEVSARDRRARNRARFARSSGGFGGRFRPLERPLLGVESRFGLIRKERECAKRLKNPHTASREGPRAVSSSFCSISAMASERLDLLRRSLRASAVNVIPRGTAK